MTQQATWENCRAEFEYQDGALIDLVVPGSRDEDWEAFWKSLRVGSYVIAAYRDGEPIDLPQTAAWMLSERDKASVMLSIETGSVTINCHFFGGEIELDIDPREVTNEETFELVLGFMKLVASAVRLSVFALLEGANLTLAFLQVTMDGKAITLPRRYLN